MQSAVATSFKQLGWNASPEWFKQCYDWCYSENPNISRQKILEEIKAGSTDALSESIQRKRSIGEQ